ncbi:transcription initiation factor TFIID subunit 11-like [Drosophila pseudoobscura]|uniref:Transcription initiation factor TFIID subunit 11-like n=1 Tax=Drosophila pseudoobscura pseudoobscura TaxID=46245 RepID=A0A6I8V0N4_DROPS|nr:transcription initiation factor TFIID subunit 11 [Drosophila pseudoobscura]
MSRQMDMREAILSTALKRSLLYDSQRKMKFLDIVVVQPERPEKPERTAHQPRERSKSSNSIDRILWEEEPEPLDPYTELLPLGQKSVAICKEAFFQQKANNGFGKPIKPFSGPWHNVQPKKLLEELIAVTNPEAPKEATQLETNLEAEESQEDKAIENRINEAMLYFMEASNPLIDDQLELLSKIMHSKDDTNQQPEEQDQNMVKRKKNKKKPQKRNRKRNKGYIPNKDSTLDCPEEVNAESASGQTANLDPEGDDNDKTLDTGASIEPQANPDSEEAGPMSFSPKVDVDTNEKPNNLEAKDEIVVDAAGEQARFDTEEGDPQIPSLH